MTRLPALVNAVLLLPVGAAIDGVRARLGLLHGERRGYKLVGLVHDWESALIKTRAKEAEVIIIADPDDFDPAWTPRIEYVGEETRDLVRYGHVRPRNDRGEGRHRRPGPAR